MFKKNPKLITVDPNSVHLAVALQRRQTIRDCLPQKCAEAQVDAHMGDAERLCGLKVKLPV